MTSMNKNDRNESRRRSIGQYSGLTVLIRRTIYLAIVAGLLLLIGSPNTGCNIYKFRDVSIPDSIKTVKVNFIENRATYINPQLSPRLTDKLRQKIVGQTRLSQTSGDNADWEISGTITGYSFSTAGISQQKVSTSRLSVTVQMTFNDQRTNKVDKFDISRSIDFDSNKSIQQAETDVMDELLQGLTDDIFNHVFSNW